MAALFRAQAIKAKQTKSLLGPVRLRTPRALHAAAIGMIAIAVSLLLVASMTPYPRRANLLGVVDSSSQCAASANAKARDVVTVCTVRLQAASRIWDKLAVGQTATILSAHGQATTRQTAIVVDAPEFGRNHLPAAPDILRLGIVRIKLNGAQSFAEEFKRPFEVSVVVDRHTLGYWVWNRL